MDNLVLNDAIFTLTTLDLSPITDTISANAPVIVTAGVGIIVTMAAIRFIPKLIKQFTRG